MLTEIIFLRHGETEYNRKKLYFGHLDPDLNEKGILEVKKASENFNENINIIYSSDLKRCLSSVKFLNLDKEIIESKNLRELNFGIFEGKSYDEIKNDYPKYADEFFNNWQNFHIPKGESAKIFQKRCVNEIEKIKENHKGQKILISSHSGSIRMILSYYFFGDLSGFWKFSIDHASITKISFDNDFVFINYLNR